MRHELRHYQLATVNDAIEWRDGDGSTRRLYASPTGTGKSVIELELLDRWPDAVLLTPRLEIVRGMLDKLGVDVPESDDELSKVALSHRISTPIRFRNLLAREEVDKPGILLIDEGHHSEADTYEVIQAYCNCPAVAFTATPYRGTPKSTLQFLETWGEPIWAITYPQAATEGVIAVPECKVVPLVDDDVIELNNGEFVVDRATEDDSLFDAIATLVSTSYDKPTMVSVSNREVARILRDRCTTPVTVVDGDTPTADRQRAFSDVLACRTVLIQINVVSEGVDLPLRRLIDVRPTMSPVYWLQLFGRITRPGDGAEYLCTNRNLERHGYLLDGCLPPRVIADAQNAFGGPSERFGSRVVGLESVGRFKVDRLPLRNGSTGVMYCLSTVEGNRVKTYAILQSPTSSDPIVAVKEDTRRDDGTRYGRWRPCDLPTDLTGFASVNASAVTEKQLAWWKRSAARHGLDPNVEPTRRQFAALPVLADLRRRI